MDDKEIELMKKGLLLWLALLFILLVAACGGQIEAAAPVAVSGETADLVLSPSVDVATVAAVQAREDVVLLDVREQWEYDAGHIPGVTLIPTGEIAGRLNEIPTDKTVIVTCRSGNRSGQVVDFLRQQGFTNVHNMEGGILAWERAGYEVQR
jgi:phage shock protein E